MPRTGDVFLGIRIPVQLRRRLIREADRRFTSESAIVRESLSLFLATSAPNSAPGEGSK